MMDLLQPIIIIASAVLGVITGNLLWIQIAKRLKDRNK